MIADQGIREFLDTEVIASRKYSLAKVLNYPRALLDSKPWLIMHKIDPIISRRLSFVF
ncbi:hypothetical protein [Pedobacter sp. JY14-1]|uniref:hypothetical protein n=1 Tax=Pedobacter sp. JY14-1 TaxID=3034151 RepID=UPI0023E28C4B|nr:hypothetical protein [Pedobacter sp. JY14-1]